jgi:hypothetical protein
MANALRAQPLAPITVVPARVTLEPKRPRDRFTTGRLDAVNAEDFKKSQAAALASEQSHGTISPLLGSQVTVGDDRFADDAPGRCSTVA